MLLRKDEGWMNGRGCIEVGNYHHSPLFTVLSTLGSACLTIYLDIVSGCFLSTMSRQATNIKGCDFSFRSRSRLALSAGTLGLRARSKKISTPPRPLTHSSTDIRSRCQKPVYILELYVFRYLYLISSAVCNVISSAVCHVISKAV